MVINAHAVGLSSKLSDFEGLAVRIHAFEKELAKLTTKLPNLKTSQQKGVTIAPGVAGQGMATKRR